jgi:hypothetical protein
MVGPFTLDAWLLGFRGYPQAALAVLPQGGFLYRLGGYHGGDLLVLDDVTFAPIGPVDGAVGPGAPTTALPAPVTQGEVVAVDYVLFLVGGKGEALMGAARAEVHAVSIKNDGGLDAWQLVSMLPEPRTNHEALVAGDYLFVVGGAADAGGLDTVFAAQVRFPAPTR